MAKAKKDKYMDENLTVRQVREKDGPKGKETQVTSEPRGADLRKIRKPGDIKTLQRRLWQAVMAAEDVLFVAGTATDQVRAIHALTQAAATYAKILETTELQEQIDALKEELAALREGVKLRKVV